VHALGFLDVEDERIAKQIAEVMSQMAGFEFCSGWPELLPGILGRIGAHIGLSSQRDMILLRSLLRILKSVIRVLASKRLPADKRAFAELAPSVFEVLCSVWSVQSETFLSVCAATQCEDSSCELLGKTALCCMKILCCILVDGVPDFRAIENATTYVNLLGPRLQSFVECCVHISALGENSDGGLGKCIRACIEAMAETVVELQRKDPKGFSEGGFLLPYLELFRTLVVPAAEGLEPLQIQAMNYCSQVANYATTSEEEAGSSSPRASSSEAVSLAEFFSPAAIGHILQTLIGKILVVTGKDVEEWDTDPEGYFHALVCHRRLRLRPLAFAAHLRHWLSTMPSSGLTRCFPPGRAALGGRPQELRGPPAGHAAGQASPDRHPDGRQPNAGDVAHKPEMWDCGSRRRRPCCSAAGRSGVLVTGSGDVFALHVYATSCVTVLNPPSDGPAGDPPDCPLRGGAPPAAALRYKSL
jgi:hypothetical protein